MTFNKYKKDKVSSIPATINMDLKVQNVEYTSRAFSLFYTSLDNYFNCNLKLTQDLQDKWLRTQAEAKNQTQKYQGSNVENIFNSVIDNILNEFVLDLQNVEASILNTKNNCSNIDYCDGGFTID